MRVLNDDDDRAAPASLVVTAAREALLQVGRGELAAPPRVRTELGSLDHVFTAGALADDALARRDAHTVGLVGTGRQAWGQLWALAAVRDLRQVRVYSPSKQHREGFAAQARAELGVAASATSDAASAVHDADIVVLATRSTEPVIDAADVAIGAHLTTVGPKFRDGHEAPLQLATGVEVRGSGRGRPEGDGRRLVDDTPEQLLSAVAEALADGGLAQLVVYHLD